MWRKKKDIMIESAAYELIKKEGFEEGIQRGIEQGIQKGMEQGIQKGKTQGLRRSIVMILGNRFEAVPQTLTQRIQQVENLETLEILLGVALRVESLDDFRKKLQATLEA